jgi:hypothetical protein
VRIFLDSKDLINLFRYSLPMRVDEAQKWFEERNVTLVLAQSSISEFVPVGEKDKLRVRDELLRLESFPIKYIRLGGIQPTELSAAAESYWADAAFPSHDPYVRHFWRTFWPLKPLTFHDVLLTQEIERRVNFRLHDQILMLWTDPINFQNKPELTARMQAILKSIRGNHDSPREKFDAEVGEAFRACGLQLPPRPGFERWLRSCPSVAPGWRLQYEVLKEWAGNTSDTAKNGDLHDMTHVFGLPYVEYATLDRRFVDYVSRASRRLRHFDRQIDYDSRVFHDFRSLAAHVSRRRPNSAPAIDV